MASLALIFVNRSWRLSIVETLRIPNKALWWVVGSGVVFLALILYVPLLRDLFRFAPLHADDIALSAGAGVLGIAWFEVLKAVRRRAPGGPLHAA